MVRGFITLIASIFISLGSAAAFGDPHSGFPGSIGSHSEHHGLTPGGRHYGIGRKKAMYSNYMNSMNPYLGGSYFPTSNYLSSTSGYPGYSMGYWSPLFGNMGYCYKQPGLYSNYQYGPYNYGTMPYNYGYSPNNYGYGVMPSSYGSMPYGYSYSPYGVPSSGSCYGLGVTYSPCSNNYGLYATLPNQPRILGVVF